MDLHAFPLALFCMLLRDFTASCNSFSSAHALLKYIDLLQAIALRITLSRAFSIGRLHSQFLSPQSSIALGTLTPPSCKVLPIQWSIHLEMVYRNLSTLVVVRRQDHLSASLTLLRTCAPVFVILREGWTLAPYSAPHISQARPDIIDQHKLIPLLLIGEVLRNHSHTLGCPYCEYISDIK